jgi:hypothetical protein
MKALSSSIVVAAGIYGISAAAPMFMAKDFYIPVIAFLASLAALVLGLVGWWASLKYDR